MEMRQISNLRSQDVSKEILLDLMRENVAEFSDKFFHFQYAALEMFKKALNNYSVLKLHFFQSTPTFFQFIVKTSLISIMQLIRTPNNIFYHIIAPKIWVDHCLSFFICHRLFYYAAFFLLKGKLKYSIIHFPYEISNDIIQCCQFSRRVLPILHLMVPNVCNITWYYWANCTQSLKSMNPIHKMSIDP